MLLEELVLPLRTESNVFKAGLAAAGVAVAALVAGMGLAIKATFKWADELDNITDIMGVNNKTAAALNFTLRKSGVATETLTKGMIILEKGLVKADGTLDVTGKRLKDFGIDVLDANGKVKDQGSLIGEISDKYASFSTQQEKVNFLTETFGRNGAELIDFFDTLANDGGIDAVAAKVERLGLAIDPNRYEQFNRNLEELKLVGLGMAVAFTEKVMPVVEKFLEMLSDPEGIDIGKILAWADKTIGAYIDGLAGSIDNWVSSGGPDALSEALISWIDGIGDSDAVKPKIVVAMEHLVAAMGDALREIDWIELREVMGGKIEELFAANQPTGENSIRDFWNGVEIAGTDAMRNSWIQMGANGALLVTDFWNQLAIAGADPATQAVTTWFNNMEIASTEAIKTFMNGLETSITDGFRNALNNTELGVTDWVRTHIVDPIKKALGIASPSTVFFGIGGDVITGLVGGINSMLTTLDDKLRGIAKTFFNRAAAWGQQMLQGFTGSQGSLFSAISGMVATINGILRKIITSFHIGFTFADPTGTLGNHPTSGGGGGGGSSGGNKRASGGPVIAGQQYSVAEFFRPEQFTPNTNGRIDAMQSQTVTAQIDEGRLARVIVQALMQAQGSG